MMMNLFINVRITWYLSKQLLYAASLRAYQSSLYYQRRAVWIYYHYNLKIRSVHIVFYRNIFGRCLFGLQNYSNIKITEFSSFSWLTLDISTKWVMAVWTKLLFDEYSKTMALQMGQSVQSIRCSEPSTEQPKCSASQSQAFVCAFLP